MTLAKSLFSVLVGQVELVKLRVFIELAEEPLPSHPAFGKGMFTTLL